MSDKDQAETPQPMRYKMSLACSVCRRRKVRCDDQFPCSRCTKSGIECKLEDPKPRPKPKRISRHNTPRAQKRSRVLSRSPSSAANMQVKAGRLSPSDQGQTPVSTSESSRRGIPRLSEDTFHSLWFDRENQIICSGPSSGLPMLERLGALHWITPKPSTFPGLSTNASRSRPIRRNSGLCRDKLASACPKPWMNKLIRHHFSFTAVMWPILHKPSFLSRYLTAWEDDAPIEPEFAGLLLAICAVSTTTITSCRLPNFVSGDKLYQSAKDVLYACESKISMDYITALYYLAVFAEGLQPSGQQSALLGEAVALAFSTGLHRSCALYDMSPILKETRKRLFWALYSMDLCSSCSSGRPSLIHLWECNVEAPMVIDDIYITENGIMEHSPNPPNVDQAACHHIVRIYTVFEQVLIGLNSPNNIPGYRRPEFYRAINEVMPDRNERLARAEKLLDTVELLTPPHLTIESIEQDSDFSAELGRVLQAHRINIAINFARTVVTRQRVVADIDSNWENAESSDEEEPLIQHAACVASQSIIESYFTLGQLDLLAFFNFQAVMHLSTAGHTLIACIFRQRSLETTYMGLVTKSIELLRHFTPRLPVARQAISMLSSLVRIFGFAAPRSFSNPNDEEEEEEEEEEVVLHMRLLRRKPPPFTAVSPPEDSLSEDLGSPVQLSDEEWLTTAAHGDHSQTRASLETRTPSYSVAKSTGLESHGLRQDVPSQLSHQYQSASLYKDLPQTRHSVRGFGQVSVVSNAAETWEMNFNMIDDGLMAIVTGS